MNMPRMTSLLVVGALGAIATSQSAMARSEGASSAAAVKVALNEKLGKPILVDGRGRTLYMYASDSRNKSTCFNDATYHCSKAWPPLRSTGKPHAGPGVKSSLLGSIKRADGAAQVTYNGHPLYTDAGSAQYSLTADTKPGDINGQLFLGIWFAVSPGGKKIAH
jgi:predicted lipoprotein with Yx(FWY)xxD motif